MELYAGVDLHKNNSYLAIIDENNRCMYRGRVMNDLDVLMAKLEPYRKDLAAVVVESTFNWYWLADGLMDSGYNVRLANPCAIKQYEGMKYADDESDAIHLAKLLKLGILPQGYIYPKDERPVRDLLRKRLFLVKQKTSQVLNLQNHICRNTGTWLNANAVRKLTEESLREILRDEHLLLSARVNLSAIAFLSEQIKELEKAILEQVSLKEAYQNLLTAPGIGKILALTIMLETGDVARFSSAGRYASYCRLVSSARISNGKNKGQGNRKNGNRYLCWAYMEAAAFAIRYSDDIRAYYQRKATKTNSVVARKTVAHKIARACYYVMKDGKTFDVKRAFG